MSSTFLKIVSFLGISLTISLLFLSGYTIVDEGIIYNEKGICKDLWYSTIIQTVGYGLISLYAVCYCLYWVMCSCICGNKVKVSFNIFRALLGIGILASSIWQVKLFTHRKSECYQNYRIHHDHLWTVFYMQVISFLTVSSIAIFIGVLRVCCRSKLPWMFGPDSNPSGEGYRRLSED